MDRELAIKIIKDCKEKSFKRTLYTLNEYYEAIDMAIKALELTQTGLLKDCESCKAELPCTDAISRQAVLDLCERFNGGVPYSVLSSHDMLPSVSTENPNRCDLISREWLKTAIHNFYYGLQHTPTEEDIQAYIDAAPSVNTEKTGRCKDCKWWKDSDGIYRRGGHAESLCPINRREVFVGNGYCYMFESQESEE